MKKLTNEIFDLLSEPETFSSSCELLDSFEEFKMKLLDNLGEAILTELKKRMTNTTWNAFSTGPFSEMELVGLYSINDVNKSMCYFIHLSKKDLYYGVRFERDVCPQEKIPLIFSKAKELKSKHGWKLANEKDSWWTIYYPFESVKLKSNSDYASLLPHDLQLNTASLVDTFLNDFNQDVKDFIESSIF
jgi:hypothetical protein